MEGKHILSAQEISFSPDPPAVDCRWMMLGMIGFADVLRLAI